MDGALAQLVSQFLASGAHNPWEWGWDALVAIGTMALALATFVAVAYPIWSERQARLREKERRDKAIVILATALEDELQRVVMQVASARWEILSNIAEGEVDWDGVYRLITTLSTPVIDSAFDRIFWLNIHTARWSVKTRGLILKVVDLLRLREARQRDLDDVVDPLILFLVELQHASRAAMENVHHISHTDGEDLNFPKSVNVTKFEHDFLKWFDPAESPKERPAWPTAPVAESALDHAGK